MSELQQEYSELSPYRQIQRKINANSTEYFFSFSNFTPINHILCYPNPQQGFRLIKKSFPKKQLKKLEKLKQLKKLKIRPTLQERIIRLVQFLNLLFCRRGMPKWHSYPTNARGMTNED